MRCACVDIGSNTTRTLVADVDSDGLRQVVCEKAYTRLDTLADVVAAQVAVARGLGAERLRVVATAAIRAAADAEELRAAVHARAGVQVDVLDGREEARLAFAGATRALRTDATIAVVDVGGGSTEVAVGTCAEGVRWATSMPVGSRTLTEAAGPLDLAARQALAELRPPPAELALAVGGSATSTARLVGPRIDAASAAAAVVLLEAGETGGLDPERVGLMPAGLALLAVVADRLGCPLTIGNGGLREGVCAELAFTSAG